MSKSIFILNKVKYVLDSRTMWTLYVHSYWHTSVIVWKFGNTYKNNTKTLYRLQKRVIRIIDKADYPEHTHMIFVSCGLLKWQELVQFQTLVVLFKDKSKTLADKWQQMFVFISEDEDHRRKGHFNTRVNGQLKQMCIWVGG